MNAAHHRKRPFLSPWTRFALALLSALSLPFLFYFFFTAISPPHSNTGVGFPPAGSGRGIMHVVMFEFQDNATPGEVEDVCKRMLALREDCVLESGKRYLKMGIGGKEDSVEGLANGISHVFISEFANEEDRTYYLDVDPVHQAFKKSIGGVVKKVQVVDFRVGVF